MHQRNDSHTDQFFSQAQEPEWDRDWIDYWPAHCATAMRHDPKVGVAGIALEENKMRLDPKFLMFIALLPFFILMIAVDGAIEFIKLRLRMR